MWLMLGWCFATYIGNCRQNAVEIECSRPIPACGSIFGICLALANNTPRLVDWTWLMWHGCGSDTSRAQTESNAGGGSERWLDYAL